MNTKNTIYEQIEKKKKYNTLELKYEVKCDELDHKVLELNTEKRQKQKQQELYDKKIKELTEENLKLKNKITELKKEIKELKRRDND